MLTMMMMVVVMVMTTTILVIMAIMEVAAMTMVILTTMTVMAIEGMRTRRVVKLNNEGDMSAPVLLTAVRKVPSKLTPRILGHLFHLAAPSVGDECQLLCLPKKAPEYNSPVCRTSILADCRNLNIPG